MKTAMQELLKWAKNSDMSDTMISPQDLLNVINPLLEKEKEQIIDTFDNGIYVGTYAVDKDGEEYYNQTYDQNK
jgi:uncharacterized protein (DUF2164 family)